MQTQQQWQRQDVELVKRKTHFRDPLLAQCVQLCFHSSASGRLDIFASQIILEGRVSFEAEEMSFWLIKVSHSQRAPSYIWLTKPLDGKKLSLMKYVYLKNYQIRFCTVKFAISTT